MSKQKYTHIQTLLTQTCAMIAAEKIQREIAEHFGLEDKYVAKELFKRKH